MNDVTPAVANANANTNEAATPRLKDLFIVDYDTKEFRENSVQIFAAACKEGPFCHVMPANTLGVTRFADVDAIVRNPRVFSSAERRHSVTPEGVEPIGALLKDDPPTHTRLRRLFSQVFTPARVATQMEPRILAIAKDLVEKVLESGREFDLVRDIAIPLPVTVISELLGVDANDLPSFKRWSDDITGSLLTNLLPESPAKTARLAEIFASMREIDEYLARAIARKKKTPGDDLLTVMVSATEGGDRLTDSEILSLAKLLLVAGNETTTKIIGLTMHQILKNAPALRDLTETPGLIPGAVEEAVRLEGSIPNLVRVTTEATTLAGVRLPADTIVTPLLGAANLDASVFPDPTRYDIRRKITRHLGFGGGIHQCLGAPLARLEARIVFEELVSRMRDLAFAAPPRRVTASLFRGFEAMPLSYTPSELRALVSSDAKARGAAVADRIAEQSDTELGLDKRAREIVRVARVRELANGIKLFRLVHPTGGLLTRFTAGSHIVLHVRDRENDGRVYRNAYSLLNSQYGNGLSYFVAVALDPNGRGGSRYLHEKVTPGMELSVSVPANNFPAAKSATKHLMIAGGIGITPFLALRDELRSRGEPCELHYTFRAVTSAAFAEDLELDGDPHVRLYDNSAGQKLDVDALVRAQPEGTHVYVCGPECLLDAVIETAARYKWPTDRVHFERFGAPKPASEAPFEVECRRSKKMLTVASDRTLLETLERAGLSIPFACRAGSCGGCELPVLEGTIEHKDSVLSEAERREGKKILPCVSRGTTRLVLDV